MTKPTWTDGYCMRAKSSADLDARQLKPRIEAIACRVDLYRKYLSDWPALIASFEHDLDVAKRRLAVREDAETPR